MKKRIIPILIIFCLLIAGNSYGVYSYAESQNIFYIRHVHTGDSQAGTGCYTSPIYHVHNEPGDNECYTPVYHAHEGTPDVLGGCYTIPVLHYHTGDDSQEGGCFVPKYHEHGSECYSHGTCYVSVDIESITTTGGWCNTHGGINMDTVIYRERHSNCGSSGSRYSRTYCTGCGSNSPQNYSHSYDVLNCSVPADTIEGYVLGCGHEEGDVDHYEAGCNLEGTVVGYDLTCSKTADTIDGYDIGCGISEGDPVAQVTVLNDGNGHTSEVNLYAQIEDLSGGRIDCFDATIIWHDAQGNEIGSGDSIIIDSNGKYDIEIKLDKPGIDRNSLKHDIDVNNIYIAGNEAYDGETHTTSGEENDDSDKEVTPSLLPTPWPVIIPSLAENNTQTDTPKRRENNEPSETDKDIFLSTPKKTEKTKQETKTVYTDISYGNNTEEVEIEETKAATGLRGFLNRLLEYAKTPVGKIITISAGTLLGAGLILLLLILLRNIVIVFNDDTERKRHMLGIVRAHLKEEGYCIEIPEGIYTREYTRRYAFFMGLFMIGKNKDTQILVIKDDKRVSVKLSKIMETII